MLNNKRSLEDDEYDTSIYDAFKRARNEDDPTTLGEMMEPIRESVKYKEINEISCEDCFGCKHFSEHAFKDPNTGEVMLKLFKIYTNSRLNLPTKAIAWQMKQYFDHVIKPKLPKDSEGNPSDDWSLESIKEHVDKHMYFPTAEIFEQLTALKNFRLILQDMVLERDTNGVMFINQNHMKLLLMIDKQIIMLMEKQKNVADMVGYNKILKF